MPPDDDLFSTEGEPVSTDETPAGTDAAPSPGINKEELAGLIQQFVEPNTRQMENITQTQSELVEAVRAISDRVGMSTNGAAEANVDVSEFLSDPQSHIQDIATKVAAAQVREQVAPLLGQMVQQTYNDTITRQEAKVDAEFGPGAWKDHFWPELKPIFDRTQKEAPSQLGNTDAIQRAVDTVKGAKFETLAQARVTALSSKEEAKEAERADLLTIVQSNLTGGISRPSGKAVLTEDMRDYIDREFRATGEKVDEKDFLKSVNTGSTLSDWLASQGKE